MDESGKPVNGNDLVIDTPKPDSGPDPNPVTPPNRPVCLNSQTVVQGIRGVCQGTLIFSEDFNKPDIKSLSNWEPENMFPQEPVSYFNFLIFGENCSIYSLLPLLIAITIKHNIAL